jgi:hypothetical protein
MVIGALRVLGGHTGPERSKTLSMVTQHGWKSGRKEGEVRTDGC